MELALGDVSGAFAFRVYACRRAAGALALDDTEIGMDPRGRLLRRRKLDQNFFYAIAL